MGLLTKLPRWANTASAGITEPLESKKDVGWVASEKPPAQYWNWLFKTIYDACVVLDGLQNTGMNWAVAQGFQADVVMAQTLVLIGKLTANGGQELKGNLALIDTIAQTILKTSAGGLKVGTGASGGDFELQAAGTTLLKLLASGSMDAQAKILANLGAPASATDAMRYGDSFPTPAWIDGSGLLTANFNASGGWCSYQKDRAGNVHLNVYLNVLVTTTAGATVLTLPAGFRPATGRPEELLGWTDVLLLRSARLQVLDSGVIFFVQSQQLTNGQQLFISGTFPAYN
jgi:hypothetical protein